MASAPGANLMTLRDWANVESDSECGYIYMYVYGYVYV